MRLPPLSPDELDQDQRAYHDDTTRSIAGRHSGFTTKREDGALVGPWSVWIRNPEVGRAANMLITAVAKVSNMPPRIREIVILTIGGRYNAAYELYAHCAVAGQVGLSTRQIAALAAGQRPEGLSDEEALAFDCASALARGGVLPGFLYAAAEKSFGVDGLAHLIYLAGAYAFVSIVLNGHEVPAPELAAHG